MGKREESEQRPQQEATGTGRVYKRSDVHRRTVDAAHRRELTRKPQSDEPQPEPEPQRGTERTRFVDEVPPAAPVDPDAQAEERRSHFVVIGGGGSEASADADSQEHLSDETRPTAASAGRGARRPDSAVPPAEAAFVPSGKDAPSSDKPQKKRHPVLIVVGIVVLVLVVLMAAFSWNRWLRYDDAQDVQGTWFIDGTDIAITIDEQVIRMNEEVSYEYELDARAKTISYSFGQLQGQGRYWFSADRSRLIIVEGEDYTGFRTFFEDLSRAPGGIVRMVTGDAEELPQGEGVVVLSRTAPAPEPVEQPDASGQPDAAGQPAASEQPAAEQQQPSGEQQSVNEQQPADEQAGDEQLPESAADQQEAA